MQILVKNVYGSMGDQCYNYKNQNIIIFDISFSKYRYYSEYHNVAKFIG